MAIYQKMQNIMQHKRNSFIEGRISELENKISRADVIDTSSFDNSRVTFGTTVKITELSQ